MRMPLALRLAPQAATQTRIARGVWGGAWGAAAPFLDLGVRLWLAQAFLVSGLLKAADWQTALYLASYEYPVSWLDPVAAAYLGVAVEIGGAVCLALGVLTRIAALAMLALSLVIQFSYVALDVHLFWAALLGWYVVHGAGRISLDHALSSGLADSALPLAAPLNRALRRFSEEMEPAYLLAVRLWLGAALFGLALPGALFPVGSTEVLSPWFAAPMALLIGYGAATRTSAAALLFVVLGVSLMNPGADSGLAAFLALLALLAVHGAGHYSADQLILERLERWQRQSLGAEGSEMWPHVVVVGAGFGGLACAASLRHLPVRITLIDRHNYHLFQPLLYQVATATLSPGDIASPIRSQFRDDPQIRVLMGEVTGIDPQRQQVHVGAQSVAYDYLVLATGASHSYFGRDDWAPYAPGLKRIEDATAVRRRILSAFERAEASEDAAERARLLTFLIVGAGPTGVELAGAIAELARFGLAKEFRRFDPADARMLLVQSGERILPTFPEQLSRIAARSLERLGVEVIVNSRVKMIDDEGVMVGDRRIEARTVLWAAGVIASPAAEWLAAERDNAGRIKVGPDLSVPGLPNVFAIGDTALSTAWGGKPVPGLAPAAKQGGQYVARVLRTRLDGRRAPPPFRYRHLGSLATIGRKSAVAQFGRLHLWGTFAWWLWGAVHILFLVGLRNRLSVMFDWFWSYLTFRVATRLITGEPLAAVERRPASARA